MSTYQFWFLLLTFHVSRALNKATCYVHQQAKALKQIVPTKLPALQSKKRLVIPHHPTAGGRSKHRQTSKHQPYTNTRYVLEMRAVVGFGTKATEQNRKENVHYFQTLFCISDDFTSNTNKGSLSFLGHAVVASVQNGRTSVSVG